MSKTPAWTRKEGKNPKGGLNEKGRASAKAQGMNLILWTVFILATASIGLLAMCSRLFWLEGQSKARSA